MPASTLPSFVVGHFVHRRFEHAAVGDVLFERVPLARGFQQITDFVADRRRAGIAHADLHVVARQIGDALDVLRVPLLHRDHRTHLSQRQSLGGQALFLGLVDVRIFRGQKQITRFADVQLAEQRVRAAVLQLHRHSVLLLVLLGDRLHRITHARRTVHEQLVRRRRLAGNDGKLRDARLLRPSIQRKNQQPHHDH